MKTTFAPRTELGLAVPPTPWTRKETAEYRRTAPDNRRCFVSRHHLYWPRTFYNANGPESLMSRFREHRFNSVWLFDPQHQEVHGRHHGTRPPKPEIMGAFLDEACLLDELKVCVRAVEMLNAALYEGKVGPEWLPYTEEKIDQRVAKIAEVVHLSFEVVPATVAAPILREAAGLLAA